MIDGCPAKPFSEPDDVANVAVLPVGPDGAFITGSDFLTDGALPRPAGLDRLHRSSDSGGGSYIESGH